MEEGTGGPPGGSRYSGNPESQPGQLQQDQRVCKVLGMVNCVPEFERHPFVINGCSELFAQVWGADKESVAHAVGMGSLPENFR